MKVDCISKNISGPLMLGKIFWRERNKIAQLKMNGVFIIFYVCLLYIRIMKEGHDFVAAVFSPVLISFLLVIVLMNILPFIYFYFYYFFHENKQIELGKDVNLVENLQVNGSKILLIKANRKLHIDIWCSTQSEANELYHEILASKRC